MSSLSDDEHDETPCIARDIQVLLCCAEMNSSDEQKFEQKKNDSLQVETAKL